MRPWGRKVQWGGREFVSDPRNGPWIDALWAAIDAGDSAGVRELQAALRLPVEARPPLERELVAAAPAPEPAAVITRPAPVAPPGRRLLGAYAKAAARRGGS